ncbi:MAG: protein-disulfide reductase DsbD [Sulfuriflexus sp.]|nr:protein-disulfide reductase DsbD [Sulfuriflexus sp.]
MMKKILIAALGLLMASPLLAINEEDLLPPDQAFTVNARAIDANTVEVEWNAADGYYMYNDKFNFKSETADIELGNITLPPGKKKIGIRPDGTEGELEIYRHKLAIKVPLVRNGDSKSLRITVGGQGCADLGVCYPPAKHTILLNLPDAAAAPASGLQKLSSLGNSLLGGGQREFLAPDEAFAYQVRMDDNGNIVADWTIAEGYYLYKEKFSFKTDTAGVQLGEIKIPAGTMHHGILPDGSEGDVEVYLNTLTIIIPVDNAPAAGTLAFTAKFQGCADAGICYPPMTKKTDLVLSNAIATKSATTSSDVANNESSETENGYLWYILVAFVVGLGLTFTPCVLPMIPILSSIIVGQSQDGQISKFKGGMLAASYVFGTSVIYTAAGVVAGKSGGQLQAYFQDPLLIGGVSIILVLLALSMFGLFTIQMPASIQSRMQTQSTGLKGGSLFGVFIMGVLSSMIVGACASPILLSVLLVAIESQDPVLGGLIMFSMSWGMGVVLIAIGIGAGALIPKAGTWMDNVKYFFGVLLIGVAIYILTVLPGVPVLLLWGVFFITLGIYLGATQSLPEGSSGYRVFWKGIGTVLLIWGVLSLLGGMQGNRDIMQPINFSNVSIGGAATSSNTAESAHELFIQIRSEADLDRELAKATAAGKPVIIDFFATWCTDCIRMEKSTFADAAVTGLMNQYVALQIDVTDPSDPITSAVQKRLGVYGPPALLFFSKQGQRIKSMDFYGYKDANEFAAHIKQAL